MREQKRKFTKAAFATHVAAMSKTINREFGALAQGMWNPEFCSSCGSDDAFSLIEQLEDHIKELKVMSDFKRQKRERT